MEGLIRSARLQGGSSGFQTGGWKVSTRPAPKPYQPILKDVYPRNEYTRMPDKNGPKYFTGRFLTLDYKDAPHVTSSDVSTNDRPVVFKSQNIEKVQTRKKYGENLKGFSSVPLHLCNDTSSYLYQRSLQPSYGDVKRLGTTTRRYNADENRPGSRSRSDITEQQSSVSRYPYALHINPWREDRVVTPASNYSYTRTWINTKYPTTRIARRQSTSNTTNTEFGLSPRSAPDNTRSKVREALWGDREERMAMIQNAPEWYSEFFPRQKVADALKFMGRPKPNNQTSQGKEHDINFHYK